MDIDFIKYSLADESIDAFISKLNCLDGIKISRLDVYKRQALYYLMSPTFLRYANQCSYGVKMPRLGTADGRKAIFPLPPIEEQHRIANSISRYFIQMDNILSALL